MNNIIIFLISLSLIFGLKSKLTSNQQLNNAPIIGLLLQQSSQSFQDQFSSTEWSYFPAAYVKFIESGGARVVPVYYDAPKSYYDQILPQLNGILFPGGYSPFFKGSQLFQSAYYIFQKVIEMNDNGIHFPLWGTCQGFEIFNYFVSGFDENILSNIDDDVMKNHEIKILKTKGSLYKNMPYNLKYNAENYRIQFLYHNWAVFTETFRKNKNLTDFFYLSSVSHNNNGIEYVASIEAKKYPIYGTQFHPEDNAFAPKYPANHTLIGVQNTQYYSDFFVQEARKNQNKFHDKEEETNSLIYNYNPIYTQGDSDYYQVYFIKNYNTTHPDQ